MNNAKTKFKALNSDLCSNIKSIVDISIHAEFETMPLEYCPQLKTA